MATKGEKISKALKGNTSSNKYEKYKDTGLLQDAYEHFCKHLSEGYIRESWYYEDEENNFCLSYQTLMKYIKEHQSDFPAYKEQIAYSKGYKKWEKIATQGVGDDKIVKNPACLQMILRNKYGWDKKKEDVQTNTSLSDAVSDLDS